MRIKVRVMLILLCAVSPLTVHAATCTITATSVNFGNYDIFSAIPSDSSGTITVSCNRSLPVTVSLTTGSSGSFFQRQMRPLAGGTDRLVYNLFTTASLTSVWGDGTGSSAVVSGVTPNRRVPLMVNVYGRIPAGQDVRAGAFTDTLTATVTW